jgi:hypothetical protein
MRGSNEIEMALGFIRHIHQEWEQHQIDVKDVSIPAL